MLLCPVRGCHQPLARVDRRMECARKHSFDIARSGYINLLQPQDRRSQHPGDSTEMTAARGRLHESGITAPLLQAIERLVIPSSADIVLDVGCGEGFYLRTLAREHRFAGHGIDISVPAIEAAARRDADCKWVVANADRFVPYANCTFSLVLSITARMNSGEFRRVLQEDGRLLVAIPAPDDLTELRGPGRDRVARTVEEFASHFALIEHRRATTVADLNADAVHDVALSIYRPRSPREENGVRSEPRMTFSLDLLLFRPRAH